MKNINSKSTGYTINEQDVKNLHQTNLAIEGMYCDACAYAIKSQLEEVQGVISADINAIDASGVVIYDADRVDPQKIALASTVYPATVIKDKKI